MVNHNTKQRSQRLQPDVFRYNQNLEIAQYERHTQTEREARRTMKNNVLCMNHVPFHKTMRSSVFFELILIALLLPLQQGPVVEALLPHQHPKKNIGRRGALETIASITAGAVTATNFQNPKPVVAAEDLALQSREENIRLRPSPLEMQQQSFDAYCLTPAENYVRSKLDKIESREFLSQLATHPAGSVWLGEHHNSVSDHNFQAMFIREVHKERNNKHSHLKDTPMAIGLEQVQSQFQPILDDYVHGNISLGTMKTLVQWDQRWTWPFENYREIFVAAKELGIRLLALNVDSEDLVLVEKEGYPGLPTQQLHKYIKDPIGFAEFAKAREFQAYTDYVIKPSFELHQRLGLLEYTIMGEPMESEMTFGRFLSGRLLWDEGIASTAFSWCAENPQGLLVGLVGADHVKYKNGVTGRFSRMAKQLDAECECKGVVINPTLVDSFPSGTITTQASVVSGDSSAYDPERVTLQLRYSKLGEDLLSPKSGSSEGVLSLSDYVVVT